jgi:hypothetical protein
MVPQPMPETETPIYDALTRQYGDPHIPPISLVLPSFQASQPQVVRRIRGRLPAGRDAATTPATAAASDAARDETRQRG